MRATLLFLAAATVLGLIACAGGPRPVATTGVSSDGPLPVADHDWFLTLTTTWRVSPMD